MVIIFCGDGNSNISDNNNSNNTIMILRMVISCVDGNSNINNNNI